MGDAADDVFDAAFDRKQAIDAMKAAGCRPCDVCEGTGVEPDDDEAGDGPVEDCHLCEGVGWFDKNGDPCEL
jgi:DnaJ-class molecular chaperone